jgi:hypothetical protein
MKAPALLPPTGKRDIDAPRRKLKIDLPTLELRATLFKRALNLLFGSVYGLARRTTLGSRERTQ